MKRIVLISCVSSKGKQKAMAKDLYKGSLFTYSMEYAKSLKPDTIFILSAKYHLLDLEKVIEPYDVTLSKVSSKVKEKKPNLKVLTNSEAQEWGKKVISQLGKIFDIENDTFIFLAGQSYVKPLRSALNKIEEPLKGLKQGERVKFLADEL